MLKRLGDIVPQFCDELTIFSDLRGFLLSLQCFELDECGFCQDEILAQTAKGIVFADEPCHERCIAREPC